MPITPPVADQEASATNWAIPITDEVNRMTPLVVAPTAWVNLTLINGWAQSAGSTVPSYRKIGDIVYLRGSASGNKGTALAILPVGFRPLGNLDFLAYHYTGGYGWGVITIQASTGNILGDGTVNPQYLSLAQVFFSTI